MARLKFQLVEPTVALECSVKATAFQLLLRTLMDQNVHLAPQSLEPPSRSQTGSLLGWWQNPDSTLPWTHRAGL